MSRVLRSKRKSKHPQARDPFGKKDLEIREGRLRAPHLWLREIEGVAREWKTLCGAGGTVKNGAIEIQGDKVPLIRQWFLKRASR